MTLYYKGQTITFPETLTMDDVNEAIQKALEDYTPSDGTVDWDNVTNKPDLALKSDLTTVYRYKGNVPNFDSLPQENEVGDVYNAEDTGMNYAWTGTVWDALGMALSIESISDNKIEEIFSQVMEVT